MEHEFHSFLYKLVRPADEGEAVDVVELCRDLAAKQPAGSPRAYGPGFQVLRVAPHQVAEGAFMGNLADPLYCPHLYTSSNIS